MQQPKLLSIPFAKNADASTKNEIPDSPGPTLAPQQATWEDGFPIITMQPPTIGGIPPQGGDFNGVLNALSEHTVYQNAGGMYKFSAELAASIGGYSKGAILISDDGETLYRSRVDGNFVNPNVSGAGAEWANAAADDSLRQDLASESVQKPGAAIVGFKQRGANSVGRSIQSKGEDSISFTDFGGKLDGSDESGILNQAISDVSAMGGGKISIPFVGVGTLRIDSQINMKENVWVDIDPSVTVDVTNVSESDAFRASGEMIGAEVELANVVDLGSVVVQTKTPHGLSVGDWCLLKSQRACLHDDAGPRWRLGETTTGTKSPFFAEPVCILSVDSPTQVTLSAGTLFPDYRPDKSQETYAEARNSSTIQKIGFLNGVRLTGGQFIKRGGEANVFRGILCDLSEFNPHSVDLGRTRGAATILQSCFRSKGYGLASRPTDWDKGEIDHSAFNSFKDIGSWFCDWNLGDYFGSQGWDQSFANGGHPSIYPTLKIFSYQPKETGWTTHGACYGGEVEAVVVGSEYAGAINRARFMQIKNMRVIGKGVRDTMPALRLSGWGALDCTIGTLISNAKSYALDIAPQGVTAMSPPEMNLEILNLQASGCATQSIYFRERPQNSVFSKVKIHNVSLMDCERGVYVGDGVHGIHIGSLSVSRLSNSTNRPALEIRPGSYGHRLDSATGIDLGSGNVLIGGSDVTAPSPFDSVIDVNWSNVRIFGEGSITSGGNSIKAVPLTSYIVDSNDAGRPVIMTAGSAVSLIVPSSDVSRLPIGSTYQYIQQRAPGPITISSSPGVSLYAPSGLTTRGVGSVVNLVKITATQWSVSGDLS